MQVRDLVKGALEICGIVAADETPAASDAQTGLRVLNSMLDTWSAENLAIYDLKREVFELTAGKNVYTMGKLEGADFDSLRPMTLKGAAVGELEKTPIYGELPEPIPYEDDLETEEVDESEQEPYQPPAEIIGYNLKVNSETSLNIIDSQRWISLCQKEADSAMPSMIYKAGTAMNETFFLWPMPNRTMGLVLYSQKALGEFSDLSDEVNLPPGYRTAIEYNLAKHLCGRYGKSLTPEDHDIARNSFATLKVKNSRTPRLISDVCTGKPFNLISGE